MRRNPLGVLGVRQQRPLHQARIAHLIRQAKGGHQHLQNTWVSQRLINIRRGIKRLTELRQHRQRDGVFLFAREAFFFLTGFGDTAKGNNSFPGAGRRGSVSVGEYQRSLTLLAKQTRHEGGTHIDSHRRNLRRKRLTNPEETRGREQFQRKTPGS